MVLTHPHSWFLDEFVCSSIDMLRRPSSIYFTWGWISTSGSSISWGVVISATRHSVQPQKSLAMVGWAWTEAKPGTSMVQWCCAPERLNQWAVPVLRKKKTEKHGWHVPVMFQLSQFFPVIPVYEKQKKKTMRLLQLSQCWAYRRPPSWLFTSRVHHLQHQAD